MDFLKNIIFSFNGILWGASIVILIYLLIKRIKSKKAEDFEKRDN